MTFLLRFWPYLAGFVLVIGAGLWINRLGYESGYNASESKWRRVADAANKALVEANERTRQQDIARKALSEKVEVEHAQALASLQSRAADADSRVRQLMRKRPNSAGCSRLPEASGAAAWTDAASPIDERSERAGSDLVALARRCEEDAAALTSLQRWVKDQQALQHSQTAPKD